MSCVTYDFNNCVLSDQKLSSGNGGVTSYTGSCVSDYIDIHDSSVSILKNANICKICFYKSNYDFINCTTTNFIGDVTLLDDSYYIRYDITHTKPFLSVCSSEPDLSPSPSIEPTPISFIPKTYMPTDLINSNYSYFSTGDYFVVKTNSNCDQDNYCDCYNVFPTQDYLVSSLYSCTGESLSQVDYSSFSDTLSYRLDLDKIMIIIFIIVFAMVFLLKVLCSSLFKGVFK